MTEKINSKVSYFLVGLGVGSLLQLWLNEGRT
jgi:hypothetical protein